MANSSMLEKIGQDLRAETGRGGVVAFLGALILSPGFYTVLLHRITASLYGKGVVGRVFGKIVWRWSVATTGCYLHPQAEIGGGLKLPHPIAIVVGKGARLGEGLTIYQNVTIGVSRETDVYPTLGCGVKIFPGAVIVGPVMIGANTVIGANAFVSIDAPDGSVLYGVPARIGSSARKG
jgi:serine O-acetyltransferase